MRHSDFDEVHHLQGSSTTREREAIDWEKRRALRCLADSDLEGFEDFPMVSEALEVVEEETDRATTPLCTPSTAYRDANQRERDAECYGQYTWVTSILPKQDASPVVTSVGFLG
jgi:hypothetical protein